ncbi:MAG: DMT family transporter [Candidatus Pacebacteria bacterium]|nr:DMT family transporter [Candidatus Paceibacterota bacterium]
MTTVGVGIGFAFIAMLCWGFGDFLIQRSTRKLGDWETLFLITGFGTVALLPFAWRSFIELFIGDPTALIVLMIAAAILLGSSLLDFEALRKGKLAIVEPIWSFEIVSASLLGFFILGERISWLAGGVIALLMSGLVLVAFREKRLTSKILLEKGVAIALIAALAMGCANFFLGWGGRESDPILANFFVNAFMAIGTGVYLIAHVSWRKPFRDLREHGRLLVPMMISDNVAWVAYAFSMSLAPIAIATALSESYIIVTVLLGLAVNKERLQRHQKAGLIIAIAAAIALALIAS